MTTACTGPTSPSSKEGKGNRASLMLLDCGCGARQLAASGVLRRCRAAFRGRAGRLAALRCGGRATQTRRHSPGARRCTVPGNSTVPPWSGGSCINKTWRRSRRVIPTCGTRIARSAVSGAAFGSLVKFSHEDTFSCACGVLSGWLYNGACVGACASKDTAARRRTPAACLRPDWRSVPARERALGGVQLRDCPRCAPEGRSR